MKKLSYDNKNVCTLHKIDLDIFVTVYQLQTPTWRHQKVEGLEPHALTSVCLNAP
jgi:hypothetical protein